MTLAADLPHTAGQIRHFAATRPHDDAVIENGTRYSYARFAQCLAQMGAELAELSIGPGMIVGVESENRFVQWLIILACESLGAATISLAPFALVPGGALVARCQVLFSDADPPTPLPLRHHRITLEWITRVFSRPVAPGDWTRIDTPPDPNSLLRITSSSGTTGEPKLLGSSGGYVRILAMGKTRDCPLHRFERPRFLTLYSFAVRAAHLRATGTIHLGGTVIFSRGTNIYADITRHRPHVVSLVVGALAETLRFMPARFRKPDALVLSTTGGALSPNLRRDALARLATDIIDIYSTSETSTIALLGADGIGTLVDGIEVALLDDGGTPVSPDTSGIIAVRGPTVFSGYLDDPALTARVLREGWFITNDLGVIPSPGRLRVLGRNDDMLNIGGIKEPPGPIEARLAAIPGIRQAAVVVQPNAQGLGELAAALELEADTAPDIVEPAVQAILRSYGPARPSRALAALPLTRPGKVDRRAVATLMADLSSPPPPTAAR